MEEYNRMSRLMMTDASDDDLLSGTPTDHDGLGGDTCRYNDRFCSMFPSTHTTIRSLSETRGRVDNDAYMCMHVSPYSRRQPMRLCVHVLYIYVGYTVDLGLFCYVVVSSLCLTPSASNIATTSFPLRVLSLQ